ncbi:MAG: glycine dehydrogenase subunit 2, partial [Anaerovoracaceae bacterium]
MKRIDRSSKIRTFHQAQWNESIIFELSRKGERGILVPRATKEIEEQTGKLSELIPDRMRRKTPPALPEISQPRVLRHYTRISQETLGADVNIEIGQGTCTVKYSPKINDQLARLPEMTELHPRQDPETVQGILQIMHETDLYMRE